MFPLIKRKGLNLLCIGIAAAFLVLFDSCTTVDVFEKNVAIPDHAWSSNYKPQIEFEITDSTARYNIFIVLRHTDAYRYKNIWVNVQTIYPAGDSTSQALDLMLATDEKGWLGSGMDDIFEHRIQITPPRNPISLPPGTYRFILENIMREDPLKNVMNVGIRLEKA